MTYEIASNNCEICASKNHKVQAKLAMNDKQMNLHFCCEKHVNELWDEIGKP
jgi:hypothetical protein